MGGSKYFWRKLDVRFCGVTFSIWVWIIAKRPSSSQFWTKGFISLLKASWVNCFDLVFNNFMHYDELPLQLTLRIAIALFIFYPREGLLSQILCPAFVRRQGGSGEATEFSASFLRRVKLCYFTISEEGNEMKWNERSLTRSEKTFINCHTVLYMCYV